MAYDRYDRDERSRWSSDRNEGGSYRGRQGERGFWDRASDEVASWFGDDEAERRRRQDERMRESERNWRGSERGGWQQDRERSENRDYGRSSGFGREQHGRDLGREQERERGRRDWYETRGPNERGGFSESDYNPNWRRELSSAGSRDWDRGREDRDWDRGRSWSEDRDWDRSRGREGGYRPMTGDYGRGGQESERFLAGGYPAGERGFGERERGFGERERRFGDRERDFGERERRFGDRERDFGERERDFGRSETPYRRDEYRRTSFAGSRRDEREFDPHYTSWRDRHLSDLDRDYDDYRRENQSRFESDFTSWRERRQQKRGLLGHIREHMEVVGKDDQHVGTVDKVAGDRIILTKSDPESGGHHHSLSCSEIDRIEGDKVILDCTADEARKRWRDEERSRALFEREDQGEMGPRSLNRSFEGTYR